jgi:hypothetical protein
VREEEQQEEDEGVREEEQQEEDEEVNEEEEGEEGDSGYNASEEGNSVILFFNCLCSNLS